MCMILNSSTNTKNINGDSHKCRMNEIQMLYVQYVFTVSGTVHTISECVLDVVLQSCEPTFTVALRRNP